MQDLHHKKGELWPQEALRLVGNEGPNGLLGNWVAGKQVIAVKWFWLTNQMACLPGLEELRPLGIARRKG